MVRKTYMTNYSFEIQYKENKKHYEWFKLFLDLDDRTTDKLHDTLQSLTPNDVPPIETLTHISNKWKWIQRAIDYDLYNVLLDRNKKSKHKYNNLSNRLQWLENTMIETMNDTTKSEKDKLTTLEHLSKTESIISNELSKEYENIKRNTLEWGEYQKNKFNFEAEKQKDLEKVISDYMHGYINETEYQTEIKDYSDTLIMKLVENIKNPLLGYTQPFDNETG